MGEQITVARRHGDEWFVGALTNNEARSVAIDLDFLQHGEKYVAEIYTDGGRSVKTRTHVKVERKRVTASDRLKFDLMASGGVAIRLVKDKR